MPRLASTIMCRVTVAIPPSMELATWYMHSSYFLLCRFLSIANQCLHPACQSVNLCESCEALPGATQAHPPSHPLVKFKEDYTSVSSSSSVGRDRRMPKSYWEAIFDFARSSGESLLGYAQDALRNGISTGSERTNECPICYEDMTGNEALGADCVHTLCCSCRDRIVAQARVDRRRATCHACRLPYPRQEWEQDEPGGNELVLGFESLRFVQRHSLN